MRRLRTSVSGVVLLLLANLAAAAAAAEGQVKRYLYVATPGIRNYLEYGGHGLVVYDIDAGFAFVKRIPTGGVDDGGKPINVKGVCVSVPLKRAYVSTLRSMMAIDLVTERLVWERKYDGGCDRMAISPDGKVIYLPSLESDHWHVVDAASGDVIATVTPRSGAHNTVYGADGRSAYLAGLKSKMLTVAETAGHTAARQVGPFTQPIRPFTVNGKQTLIYANVNGLLGFEVGDLVTGKMLHRVEVQNYQQGTVKRHGCPSHGVGLTPDEKEVWVCDAANQRVHIFDNTVMPPKQVESVALRDQPGWVTFSLDGRYAWPSTGEVVDVKTRKIVFTLKDERGGEVHSEKMVEVHWDGGNIVRAGDQFGVGRVR